MPSTTESVSLTAFLVKIASRCNLDCDYCYMYHHADQSWRSMPRVLSEQDQSAFAVRLSEYVEAVGLKRCAVIFHGGEPLLAGANTIVEFARRLRHAVGPSAQLDVGIQTNGLLLTDDVLDLFESASIDISLSIDGPRQANDLHRTTRSGRSSFEKVKSALDRLKARPLIFAGVIAVIDTRISPETLFEFFDQQDVPKLDFLLPDANHLRPPPGRLVSRSTYRDWLIQAFDIWLDKYSHLRVRTFEALLDAISGLPSKTDAFGFGDVSLITLETDGTYHDLDVLKITHEGATRLHGSVRDTPIIEITTSSQLLFHRRLLSKDGVCSECRRCPVVDVCGGGSVPHRYGREGFDNPTIYCQEMFALIHHARTRLSRILGEAHREPKPLDFSLDSFELAESSKDAMTSLRESAASEYLQRFDAVLEQIVSSSSDMRQVASEMRKGPSALLKHLACRPGAVAWARAYEARQQGRAVFAVDGTELNPTEGYLDFVVANRQVTKTPQVNAEDEWLRLPFGNAIDFTSAPGPGGGEQLINEALQLVRLWRPALYHEMIETCGAVQFVQDRTADPDKIISFSDDAVPGALYVSLMQGARVVDAYDLADSLIHEHRHQKLYLLERLGPTVQPGAAKVVSPWREELRPPSGLLHATFVFVELRRFWLYVRDSGPAFVQTRAVNQLHDTDARLKLAFSTLQTCPLSATGLALVRTLERAFLGEFESHCPA